MGNFFLENPFGGIFDFNGDGIEDESEQYQGLIIEEEYKTGKMPEKRFLDNPFAESDLITDWRRKCEDGSMYGVDPINYSTLSGYNEALHEARYGWRDELGPDFDTGVFPEDYETPEEFESACMEEKYGWRNTVESGFDVGLDPKDFESKDEYEDALEEARYGWRETAEDGSDEGIYPDDYETAEEYYEALENARADAAEEAEMAVGPYGVPMSVIMEAARNASEMKIKESDYPNKRRYDAAVTLYGGCVIYGSEECKQEDQRRCRFILEKGDSILAANYLTENGEFLFSQAVKDNFVLPVTLPDEDERSEFSLKEILEKLAKKDAQKAMEVWAWCVEQFFPYVDYAPCAKAAMADVPVSWYGNFPEKFQKVFLAYLNKDTEFRERVIRNVEDPVYGLSGIIAALARENFPDAAEAVFDDALAMTNGEWRVVNELVDTVIYYAKYSDEIEPLEFIELRLLPKLQAYPDGMIQDEIEGWRESLAEYREKLERTCEKYAYSRGNAWRNTVPDGDKYCLDPCDFDSEREYMDAYNERKYFWRRTARMNETYGLEPDNFETQEEYREAWKARYEEHKREQWRRQDTAWLNDKTVYTYCGVKIPHGDRIFSFRTNDDSIEVGDAVIVSFGLDNREIRGIVVSVGKYAREAVPYPVDRTKFIIRKDEIKASE